MKKLIGMVIAFVISGTVGAQVGTVSVAWDQATADATHSAPVEYRVCVGTVATNLNVCDVVPVSAAKWCNNNLATSCTTDTGCGGTVGSCTNVQKTTVSGLQDCTTYYVGVKAVDVDGDESVGWGNVVSGWAQPRLTGVTPGSVQANATTELTLTGANFTTDTAVEVKVGATTTTATGVVVATPCTVVKATVRLPSAGTPTTTVRIGAVDAQGKRVGKATAGLYVVTGVVGPRDVTGTRRGDVVQ